MKLVADPQEVERLAEEREDENWTFRDWIREEFDFDDERLMSVVRQLADEITAQIDCTQCANCCRKTATEVDDEDIERLAAALEMTVPDFREAYLEFDSEPLATVGAATLSPPASVGGWSERPMAGAGPLSEVCSSTIRGGENDGWTAERQPRGTGLGDDGLLSQ